MKNWQSQGKWNCFANVLENVTVCFPVEKFESGGGGGGLQGREKSGKTCRATTNHP